MATIEVGGPRIWVFSAPPNLVDVELNDTTITKEAQTSRAAVVANGTFFNPRAKVSQRITLGIVKGRGKPAQGTNQGKWASRFWFGITHAFVAEIGGPGLPANYASKYDVFMSGAGLLLQGGKFPPGNYPGNVLGNFSKAEGYHNKAIRVALGIRKVNGKQEVVLYVADGKEGTKSHPPQQLPQTLKTVGNALLTIGVTDAIWLDGSSSLSLAVNGQVKHKHSYSKVTNWILMYDE